MAEPSPYTGGPDTPLTVLYIGGTGRTGSTLLTRLLGRFDNWFAGGELAFLWRYGLAGGGRCSCGDFLSSCGLWARVIERAGIDPHADAERMVALRKRFWSGHLPLMVSAAETRRRLDALEEFPATVERVYRAIADVTGARVLIDSSKEPHYSFILRERTSLDVRFLHLVRDPRAVGFSWQRDRPEVGLGGTSSMDRRGPATASTYYAVSNLAAEALWRSHPDRYRFLRYEDFVAAPATAVENIGTFAGAPIDAADVLDGTTFEAESGHMAWGNPNRFRTGPVSISADDQWRAGLKRADEVALTGLTAGVAGRYGYSLRSPVPGAPLGRPTAKLPAANDLLGDGVTTAATELGRPLSSCADEESNRRADGTVAASFDQIAVRLDGLEGWLRPAQAERLWNAAAEVEAGGRIVEIGSYQGKSTVVLATAALPDVDIVAIDPHAGNDRGPGAWSGAAEDGQADHEAFLANLAANGVAGRVRHVREFSQQAIDDVDGPIDVLYIDGAHGYGPARSDIVEWGAKVRPGGVMLIHDVFTSVFVTLAVVRTLFATDDWRYLGRERSMAIYRKEAVTGTGDRLTNLGRQATGLPFFVRAVTIKAMRSAGVEHAARALGHDPGTGVY